MSSPSSALPQPAIPPVAIPWRELQPWLLFGTVLALVLLHFVGTEQGVFQMISGADVHEFVHDGRHLLGFPCH
ncbi:CbtB-domain containing protein [Micromonospora sp. WMMA1363]|uniref:CbtB domain-containing protein n=1 Tax=Micromonospora sp. WMMA1363 TaxID=3053985 RepID=UPI00259CEF42|nr:CbtB-domain containing protein [Micromonospora sp. WMMA1363]MDM4721495.1 CbtB-domain containing protein [Micromonospora sp. WMMA1363]